MIIYALFDDRVSMNFITGAHLARDGRGRTNRNWGGANRSWSWSNAAAATADAAVIGGGLGAATAICTAGGDGRCRLGCARLCADEKATTVMQHHHEQQKHHGKSKETHYCIYLFVC
jgi:hypothetical protein